MAEEGTFKYMLISGILITLFAWAIITFSINTGFEYGFTEQDFSSDLLNYSVFNSTLIGSQPNATSQEDSFTDLKNLDEEGGVSVTGIFNVAKNFWSYLILPFTLLSQVMSNVFNVPAQLRFVINFIITVVILLSVWRLIKQGD